MINQIELGRQMMANAAMLEDDTEFNHWARLGPILIAMGNRPDDGMKGLTPEEQQVVARALNRLSGSRMDVA
jgi:hypothetical protein